MGIPLPEVLKRVSADLGIASNDDIDYRHEVSIKIAREREQREQAQRFKKQVDDSYFYLAGLYRKFREIERSVKSEDDLERDDVVMAFELMPVIDGIMDLLSDIDIEMQYKGLQWGRRIGLW